MFRLPETVRRDYPSTQMFRLREAAGNLRLVQAIIACPGPAQGLSTRRVPRGTARVTVWPQGAWGLARRLLYRLTYSSSWPPLIYLFFVILFITFSRRATGGYR